MMKSIVSKDLFTKSAVSFTAVIRVFFLVTTLTAAAENDHVLGKTRVSK